MTPPDEEFPITPIIICSTSTITIFVRRSYMEAKVFLKNSNAPEYITRRFEHVDNLFALPLEGLLSLAKEFYAECVRYRKINQHYNKG